MEKFKSFGVISGVVGKKIIPGLDNSIANGAARAAKAVEENKDLLVDKGVNLAIAAGIKLATRAIAPDSLLDKGANLGLAITGLSAASAVVDTVKKAKNYSSEEISSLVDELLAEETTKTE